MSPKPIAWSPICPLLHFIQVRDLSLYSPPVGRISVPDSWELCPLHPLFLPQFHRSHHPASHPLLPGAGWHHHDISCFLRALSVLGHQSVFDLPTDLSPQCPHNRSSVCPGLGLSSPLERSFLFWSFDIVIAAWTPLPTETF